MFDLRQDVFTARILSHRYRNLMQQEQLFLNLRTDYSSLLNDLKIIFIFVIDSLINNKLN